MAGCAGVGGSGSVNRPTRETTRRSGEAMSSASLRATTQTTTASGTCTTIPSHRTGLVRRKGTCPVWTSRSRCSCAAKATIAREATGNGDRRRRGCRRRDREPPPSRGRARSAAHARGSRADRPRASREPGTRSRARGGRSPPQRATPRARSAFGASANDACRRRSLGTLRTVKLRWACGSVGDRAPGGVGRGIRDPGKLDCAKPPCGSSSSPRRTAARARSPPSFAPASSRPFVGQAQAGEL